ncbi:hypothetical protein OBBRIDRAFT_741244 [Obba rivulosa]|uniref:Uncharacterized protein n=1 Tax=Obba rivulosa TaxID=1052685 RepID=A0A8E2DEB1_9APHY|nr:hypothetical protein OBBRIDRAFT_741244 [Obba rivulosa]
MSGDQFWSQHPERTRLLLDYLEERVADHIILFGDSIEDAEQDNHGREVHTDPKTTVHRHIAEFLFTCEAEERSVRADYNQNAAPFEKKVKNRIAELQRQYHTWCKENRKTGGGSRSK